MVFFFSSAALEKEGFVIPWRLGSDLARPSTYRPPTGALSATAFDSLRLFFAVALLLLLLF